MTDAIVAISLLTVIGVGILSVQVVNSLARRRWRSHEQYPFLVTELQLERVRDRFLVDTRIQRYSGMRRGRKIDVEVGSGAQGVYARIDYDFGQLVDLGLRISSEHEDGFMTRVMRLREIEVGHTSFDSQFILLCRDEERLSDLLDRDVRRMLIDLGEPVRDLRLNDDGLHLQVFGAKSDDELRDMIDQGAQLATTVLARAEQLQEQREALAATEAFSPVTGSLQAINIEEIR